MFSTRQVRKRHVFVFWYKKGLPGGMGNFGKAYSWMWKQIYFCSYVTLALLISKYSRHWTHIFSSPDPHCIFLGELKGTGTKVAINLGFYDLMNSKAVELYVSWVNDLGGKSTFIQIYFLVPLKSAGVLMWISLFALEYFENVNKCLNVFLVELWEFTKRVLPLC